MRTNFQFSFKALAVLLLLAAAVCMPGEAMAQIFRVYNACPQKPGTGLCGNDSILAQIRFGWNEPNIIRINTADLNQPYNTDETKGIVVVWAYSESDWRDIDGRGLAFSDCKGPSWPPEVGALLLDGMGEINAGFSNKSFSSTNLFCNGKTVIRFPETKNGTYGIYDVVLIYNPDDNGRYLSVGKHDIELCAIGSCTKDGIKNNNGDTCYYCKSCGTYYADAEGKTVLEKRYTVTDPAIGHKFPDAWTDLNGYNSKSCLNDGCKATFFDVPKGELTMVIETNDSTMYAFPQSINPVYNMNGEDSEVTFGDGGVCAIPASWLKGIHTEWSHNLKVAEKPDHTWANACTVDGCQESEDHWVVINGERVDLLKTDELKIASLNLSDEKGYDCKAIYKAGSATYTRSTDNQWSTLCMPFNVAMENQNFRAFHLLSATADAIELEEETFQINAGVPVIIKMLEDENELSFSVTDETIIPETQTGSQTNDGKYKLVGLFGKKDFDHNTDNDCFLVNGDKLMNPAKILENSTATSVNSLPFRAYMSDNAQQASQAARAFRIGGTSTAVEELNAAGGNGKAEYYDLQGRRLNDLQKGVNIVKRGNKSTKVIIK